MKKEFLYYTEASKKADKDIKQMQALNRMMPPRTREAKRKALEREAKKLIFQTRDMERHYFQATLDKKKMEAFEKHIGKASLLAENLGFDLSVTSDEVHFGELVFSGNEIWCMGDEAREAAPIFAGLLEGVDETYCTVEGGRVCIVFRYRLDEEPGWPADGQEETE